MVLQHNMPSLNAQRHLGINNSMTAKNLEKLSSGFRINRAADDAAGLGISEKMRSQIRGLDMAAQNAENGISLIQTAEGGLNEIHAILDRMRELAVQSANGTYKDEDREQIAKEVQALKNEIDRIALSTHYNEIKLLDGSLGAYYGRYAPEGFDGGPYETGSLRAIYDMLTNLGFDQLDTHAIRDYEVNQGYISLTSLSDDFNGEYVNLVVISGSDTGAQARLALQIGDKTYFSEFDNVAGEYVFFDEERNAVATLFHSTSSSAAGSPISANGVSGVIANIRLEDSGQDTVLFEIPSTGSSGTNLSIGQDHPLYDVMIADGSQRLIFQIGANGSADQRVGLQVLNMTSACLGTMKASVYNETGSIHGIDVSTRDAANDAIAYIDIAIQQVSGQRAELGGLQNRMEFTLNNLGVTRENLQAAESSIRDLDMAKEMMEFTKNSILVQAAQSMLAQANALPQGVLSLMN